MVRYAVSACAAVAILTACSNLQGRLASVGLDQGQVRSASSSGTDLLYVSDWHDGKIFIFTYPGDTLVGTIADDGYPLGLCSDHSGNVWVANFGAGYDQLVEYAHGGTTPIATLDDPNEEPRGCSVNPLTGDLAVANGYPGNVVIYARASGSPQSYDTGVSYPFACTYDGEGNLFVDGYHLRRGDKFALSELRSGGTKFVQMTIRATVGLPGNIQWDGTYLAAGEYPSSGTIYRLRIIARSTSARLESTVSLQGPVTNPAQGVQFWLQGGTLIMPFGTKKNVNVVGSWSYPAGGNHTSRLTGFGGVELYGVTVSVPSSN